MDLFPLYSQDGKGDAAEVLFKVFNPYGSQSWYVIEAGEPDEYGNRELFAYVTSAGDAEYGYVMLADLTETMVRVFGSWIPLERDRWFKGTIADAKRDAHVV